MAASSSLILPKGELSKEELLTTGSLQEYQPWLLDDHPLRSYPTQCIPGLGPLLRNGFKSFQMRWKEYSLRAVCLVLASLYVLVFATPCCLPADSLTVLHTRVSARSPGLYSRRPPWRGYIHVAILMHASSRTRIPGQTPCRDLSLLDATA